MKKYLLILAAFLLMPSVGSAETVFNDTGAFAIAKAVKLGRGNAYSVSGMAELAGKTELTKEIPCDKNCTSCDNTTGTCSNCAGG